MADLDDWLLRDIGVICERTTLGIRAAGLLPLGNDMVLVPGRQRRLFAAAELYGDGRWRQCRRAEMTWEASRSFELGDLAEATRRYQQILDVFTDDPVAKSMLDAVERRPRPVARAVVGPGVGAPG